MNNFDYASGADAVPVNQSCGHDFGEDSSDTDMIGVAGLAAHPDWQAELDRIYASAEFSRSPVLRRLLDYLVEESLAGRGARLKAYQIAVDGLGRDESFDPQSDSYPRVQVGRLRKLLDLFYAANGGAPDSGRRIHIPVGSYSVHFEADGGCAAAPDMRPAAAPSDAVTAAANAQPRSWRTMITRLAMAALLLGGVAALAWAFSAARTSAATYAERTEADGPEIRIIFVSPQDASDNQVEMIAQMFELGLRRFDRLTVIGGVAAPAGEGKDDARDYDLDFRLATMAGTRSVFITLRHRASNSVIWNDRIRIDETGPEAMQRYEYWIGHKVSRLARASGVITAHQMELNAGNFAPGYACLLHQQAYRQFHHNDLRDRVIACLDKSLQK
ncbi:MAG: hypothetical protein R3E02_08195 [Blastomonas sp.]